METSYRIALACGSAPLVGGILFYLLWLITRSEVLTRAAGLVILITLLLALIGCVALARFVWLALRSPEVQRDRVWRAAFIAGTILSLNLPVVVGLVGQALPR